MGIINFLLGFVDDTLEIRPNSFAVKTRRGQVCLIRSEHGIKMSWRGPGKPDNLHIEWVDHRKQFAGMALAGALHRAFVEERSRYEAQLGAHSIRVWSEEWVGISRQATHSPVASN